MGVQNIGTIQWSGYGVTIRGYMRDIYTEKHLDLSSIENTFPLQGRSLGSNVWVRKTLANEGLSTKV